jgi:formylglycine-generating enzyme required for sulfatase activity
MKLVLIPPGEFEMGSTKEDTERILATVRDRNGWMSGFLSAESPPHRVTISKPFYLGACEVTQEQYLRVMGGNAQQFRGNPNRPAANVTWHNATEFCRRLSELAPERGMETSDFRLPTEAEWEYACRAGTATSYYFGDDPAMLPRCAWFHGNANAQPRPVAQLTPNAWGLFDMYGNVCEWCADPFARYNAEPAIDPEGPSSGQGRVLRGLASVDKDPAFFRSAFRHHRAPDFRVDQVGFRVVMTISH